jgi:hypothetical protein
MDGTTDFKLDWSGGRHSVEYWLKRTAQGSLQDKEWGLPEGVAGLSDRVRDDPLLQMVYTIDLCTFIHGERISLEAVSSAIGFAPSEECAIFLATQALDEARHLEVFTQRLYGIGLDREKKNSLVERFNTKGVKRFHDLIREYLDKKDFLASTIAMNVILEGLAYPIYRYETKYWSRLDPGLSALIAGAFHDEVQHVNFGVALVKSLVGKDAGMRIRATALLHEFKNMVDEVFEESRNNYVKIYREAAAKHMDVMADLEIFPGVPLGSVSEEDQVRILQKETQSEFDRRMSSIGISV